MTTDDLFSPFDPLDVQARLLDRKEHDDDWTLRFLVWDSTDAEPVEVVCLADGSLACSHGLAPEAVEGELARYINLKWPREHRLEAERARAQHGGEYRFGGDADAGLYLAELPVRVAA